MNLLDDAVTNSPWLGPNNVRSEREDCCQEMRKDDVENDKVANVANLLWVNPDEAQPGVHDHGESGDHTVPSDGDNNQGSIDGAVGSVPSVEQIKIGEDERDQTTAGEDQGPEVQPAVLAEFGEDQKQRFTAVVQGYRRRCHVERLGDIHRTSLSLLSS